MTESNIFKTQVANLAGLEGLKFSIPSYQRPYVWTQVEISKLITDLYKSFQDDRTQSYFVGTILTKRKFNDWDLIDGQQRFTTLWLIAYIFNKMSIKSDLSHFLEDANKHLKLGFEIRKEVERYLGQLLGHDDGGLEITSHEIEQLPYLKNIAEGLTTIENIIEQLDRNSLPAFGNFIYSNICFVMNETADHTDLNKLFSTINSSGVQLEQYDIVKSNLLRIIGDEKLLYSKIWEACQNMNNFIERNARSVFPESNWTAIDLSEYRAFDPVVFKYKVDVSADTSRNEFSMDAILKANKTIYILAASDNEEKISEEVYCRSIINFSQFLLHTYRLHLYYEGLEDFSGTFHVNRLIEVFTEMEKRNSRDEIKRFFHRLWDVRFVFDKYVIKWISDVDQKSEHLELVNINKNTESYYTRTNFEPEESLMLQSVLYFTGDYLRQFWLTPFLGFLLSKKVSNYKANDSQIISVLEQIDNQLSLCKSLTDKEASFRLLKTTLEGSFDLVTYLNEAKGTSFQHYWFQKLEYVLWKKWSDRSDPKFRAYRIISRNSVEHIYPQQPKLSSPINENILHSFGNLVLLNVSQNSEYSNKEVNVKQKEFENKPTTYDTLKSYFIFKRSSWKEADIANHQEEMIKYLIEHYQICKDEKRYAGHGSGSSKNSESRYATDK